MTEATLTADRAFAVGTIDPRVYGSFVEHMGRCVYTGIFEPGHPEVDERGFRRDVAALVRELGVTIVRYPGGNFVSGYDWEDGVGPVGKRPRRLDGAWLSTETNAFGTGEFIDWCRMVEVEPMLAVNFGTRGVDAARRLVEYCNHPGGTALSDLRRSHGWEAPHDVRFWCLGNEMDGPWQIGAKTAHEYGRLAQEAAKAMRLVDGRLELAACGSSNREMPTYARWEYEVLDHCFEQVDHISLHTYFGNPTREPAGYLEHVERLDAFIEEVAAIADAVAATRRSDKRIMLSLDEWNAWYRTRWSPGDDRRHPESPWPERPRLIEEHYDMADALMIGGALVAILNRCDRVRTACLAQLVNVIGPIRTEPNGPAWRQTIFHPFALTSRHARGRVLRSVARSGSYDGPTVKALSYLRACVMDDEEAGTVTVLALNRHTEEAMDLTLAIGGFGAGWSVETAIEMTSDDLGDVNTAEEPDRVTPSESLEVRAEGAAVAARLKPASWNVLVLQPRG